MESLTFEKAMQRLEEIVAELESGDLPLDESIKLYEEGVELNKLCSARLNETEKKIKKLIKRDDGFELQEIEA